MAFRHVSDQKFKCPICGKENTAHETFRCRRCARQYICDDHLDPKERVCEDCTSGKEKKGELDELGMVVVHDGEFFIGQDEDEEAVDAQPMHPLRLERFLIDQYPVTNKEFKEFKPDHEYPEGDDEKPVTNVTWHEANDYAISKGKRLPSEPEWEKAARSRDKRNYPWGNDLPEGIVEKAEGDLLEALKKYNLSPYNVRDMCGGPWEWTSSKYEPYPKGPTICHGYHEGNMAIRGGELSNGEPAKTYDRTYAHPSERRNDISFRCCKGAKQVYEAKYAGSDIKRPSKKGKADEPPPEFKAFASYGKKKKEDPVQHVDFSGMTVKEAVRKAKELEGKSTDADKAAAMDMPLPDEPLGVGPPGKLGSDKRTRPMSDSATVVEDYAPEERAGAPWGIIIISVIIVAGLIIAYNMMTRASQIDPAGDDTYETPHSTTLVSEPGFTQIDNKHFIIPEGNKMFPTNMVIHRGYRVTIIAAGWTDPTPPPLVAKLDDHEINIGAKHTFRSNQMGKLMIGYMADNIVIPEGQDRFTVQVIVEVPDS